MGWGLGRNAGYPQATVMDTEASCLDCGVCNTSKKPPAGAPVTSGLSDQMGGVQRPGHLDPMQDTSTGYTSGRIGRCFF